jgi:hypothetical protein
MLSKLTAVSWVKFIPRAGHRRERGHLDRPVGGEGAEEGTPLMRMSRAANVMAGVINPNLESSLYLLGSTKHSLPFSAQLRILAP